MKMEIIVSDCLCVIVVGLRFMNYDSYLEDVQHCQFGSGLFICCHFTLAGTSGRAQRAEPGDCLCKHLSFLFLNFPIDS
jgi:hypothetical protein